MLVTATVLIVGLPALLVLLFMRGAARGNREREFNRKMYERDRSANFWEY